MIEKKVNKLSDFSEHVDKSIRRAAFIKLASHLEKIKDSDDKDMNKYQ